jgi:hypothetical protein
VAYRVHPKREPTVAYITPIITAKAQLTLENDGVQPLTTSDVDSVVEQLFAEPDCGPYSRNGWLAFEDRKVLLFCYL